MTSLRTSLRSPLLAALILASLIPQTASAQQPIRVAIVGLVHGHVQGFLSSLPSHPEVQLVGVAEPDAALRDKFIARTHLPASPFFPTEAPMLQSTHPQPLLVYTSLSA